MGALAGGEASNEEAFLLQRLLREGLDCADLDSRPDGGLPLELHRALSAPERQASVPDLEFANAVLVLDCDPLDDAPILDLRIRKGVRRRGVQAGGGHEPAQRAGSQRAGGGAVSAWRRG